MFQLKRLLLIFLFVLASGCASNRVSFPSYEFSDIPYLRGNLMLPEGNGPFPAVIIVNGCSGILPSHSMWANWFRDHGYATLILDSFGPRNVREICTNFERLPIAKRVLDAYAALSYLGDLNEIDGQRIGIMGFSNNGVVTMDVASRMMANRQKDLPYEFAAAIAVYPSCRFRAQDYAVPTRILIGELDDWTPARLCVDLLSIMMKSSESVDLKIYQGAHHGFDNMGAVTFLPNVLNENRAGRGATVGGNAAALASAKRDTLEFLEKHMPAN
jgi:dienelactone hydrolase